MATAYLKYFLSLLIFGSNGIVASHISLSSQQIVFTRTLIGGLFLALVFFLSKNKLRALSSRRALLFLLGSGVCMGASWMCLFEAYRLVGVSVATLIYYCGPVLVLLASPFVFQERLTAPKVAGIALALCGMALVGGVDVQQSGLSWGLLCGILSAVLYALMVLFNKKAQGVSGLENTLWQLVFAFVTVGGFLALRGELPRAVPSADLPAILLLGIVNTGLACYLYFSSIQVLPAQSVSICGYLDPLSALLFSALFLQERLTGAQLVGALLILGGAAVGELLQKRPGRAAVSPKAEHSSLKADQPAEVGTTQSPGAAPAPRNLK